jgi:hypothetical protein
MATKRTPEWYVHEHVSSAGWLIVHYSRRQHRALIGWPAGGQRFPGDAPTAAAAALAGKMRSPSGMWDVERRVAIRFAPGSDDVLDVHLESAGPLRPSELSRFAWATVFAAARTARSHALTPAAGRTARNVPLAQLVGTLVAPSSRPGRRGYPDDFYRQYAQLAQRLRDEGHYDPARWIANEVGASYDAVRKWLATARRKGFLAPARGGRPPRNRTSQA